LTLSSRVARWLDPYTDDDTEGTESGSGNGITGDDETSENLDVTF